MAHVAIIGAGMAGLSCARRLLAAGVRVDVFEKSRSTGGRLATRRSSPRCRSGRPRAWRRRGR
jgi:predicted NAD/FAD-dependent oxidoreductase